MPLSRDLCFLQKTRQTKQEVSSQAFLYRSAEKRKAGWENMPCHSLIIYDRISRFFSLIFSDSPFFLFFSVLFENLRESLFLSVLFVPFRGETKNEQKKRRKERKKERKSERNIYSIFLVFLPSIGTRNLSANKSSVL